LKNFWKSSFNFLKNIWKQFKTKPLETTWKVAFKWLSKLALPLTIWYELLKPVKWSPDENEQVSNEQVSNDQQWTFEKEIWDAVKLEWFSEWDARNLISLDKTWHLVSPVLNMDESEKFQESIIDRVINDSWLPSALKSELISYTWDNMTIPWKEFIASIEEPVIKYILDSWYGKDTPLWSWSYETLKNNLEMLKWTKWYNVMLYNFYNKNRDLFSNIK
jgi:hypothetical protein